MVGRLLAAWSAGDVEAAEWRRRRAEIHRWTSDPAHERVMEGRSRKQRGSTDDFSKRRRQPRTTRFRHMLPDDPCFRNNV